MIIRNCKIKFLILIPILLSFILSKGILPIPTQDIDFGSTYYLELSHYLKSDLLEVDFNSHSEFQIDLFNDSLYITPKNDSIGLTLLDLEINSQKVHLVVYVGSDSLKENYTEESVLIKDSYEFIGDDLVLNFKHVKPSSYDGNLKEENILLMFNNTQIENKYFHIFSDRIRIMMPKAFRDGVLRISLTDNEGHLLRENKTLFSNGLPITPTSPDHSLYFSNIYYLLIDRFSDKNDSNNLRVLDKSIDSRLKFNGGDIDGVTTKINKGYFDRLGINNILISPLQINPDSAFRDYRIPYKKVMGYNGNWPIEHKQIDSRFGDDEQLNLLGKASLKKDIGLYLEFPLSQTHINHPYYRLHYDWYDSDSTGWEQPFLPKFDLSNKELAKHIGQDALYWLENFKINGLFFNVNNSLSADFSDIYLKEFLDYDYNFYSIKFSDIYTMMPELLHPEGFNSQMNFDLYLMARDHFTGIDSDFNDFNQFITRHLRDYSSVNLLSTFTSINDEPRFISVADGQIDFDMNKEPDKTQSLIVNPSSYEKLFMFTVMNNALPGIPMTYYGEEFGLTGLGEFDSNRVMRFPSKLNVIESFHKDRVSKLNLLRKEFPSLSIGDFMVLRESKNFTAWLKSYYNEKILIFFNLQDKIIEKNIPLPFESSHLISLLDDSVIELSDSTMASFVIPPYKTGVYLLKSK